MNIARLLDLYAPIEDDEMEICLSMRIQQGFAKAKPTYLPGVKIVKYNPAKTMFKGEWDRYTVQGARGHLIREGTMEPVNMPFPKLFEAQELGVHIPADTPVLAFKKRNGYMLDVTWSNDHDQLIVGTTGTIDSEYAELGRTYIKDWMIEVFQFYAGYTFTFEVCDPSDPHIFPEPQGLYLIGVRRNDWRSAFNILAYPGLVEFGTAFRGFKEDVKFDAGVELTYGEAEMASKWCDHEGFVVWLTDPASNRKLPLKLKGQHYKIRKKLARAKDVMPILKDRKFDSLFEGALSYKLLRTHLLSMAEGFQKLNERERLEYMTVAIDKIRKEL